MQWAKQLVQGQCCKVDSLVRGIVLDPNSVHLVVPTSTSHLADNWDPPNSFSSSTTHSTSNTFNYVHLDVNNNSSKSLSTNHNNTSL